MLSIGAMTVGQCDYYQQLAREDYYLTGGEPPGVWFGRGAEALSLTGFVTRETLAAIFAGYSPERHRLVQNAGKLNRQPGWDLTFSAPKSVSFLWSQLDRGRQQQIQHAHELAVLAALGYVEENFAFSRVGAGGAERVQAGLVVAVFEHSCSRALDMQLHSHALVMNVGVDGAGKSRSLLSKPFYQAKMLAGAFYRCELARQLNETLGLKIERPRLRNGKASWFEIKGIDKSILQHFSKRREAILAELGARGLESASAAAFATLGTRAAKTLVPPRNELHARWREEGRKLGFSPEHFLARPQGNHRSGTHERFREALAEAVTHITAGNNNFTRDELTRRTLEVTQEFGLPAQEVAKFVTDALEKDPFFFSLGTRNDLTRWTTQEVLSIEKRFQQCVRELRDRPFRAVPDSTVEAVLRTPRGQGTEKFVLDTEQQDAVRYLTQGPESIKCISGFAGTGKTDMLAAAKDALEKEGYRVVGTALAGVAARTLEQRTGIESDSIRMRELQLDPQTSFILKHHGKQLWRAACGKETFALSSLTIDERTVLVIDEAGMVGTRDFNLLAEAVVRGGGSIIAVGDERQLPAIDRPGSFEFLVKELEGVRLTEIRRQKDPTDQDATKHIIYGNPEIALQHYAEKGQFFVGRTTSEAEQELLSDWLKFGGAEKPTAHRIFAATRAEVSRLNEHCQWERIRAGFLNAADRVEHQGQIFMAGDRVRFDQSAKALGIQKGQEGTVMACKDGFTGKYVSVLIDTDKAGGRERLLNGAMHHARQLLNEALRIPTERPPAREDIVIVPLETLNPHAKCYHSLSLGYAMTTHLGQGQTTPNSYVLLGSRMGSLELSYVQSSRHKERLSLYASQDDAGHALTELARTNRPIIPQRGERTHDIPRYSSLAAQMKRREAAQLALQIDRTLQPLNEEISHAH